MKTAGLVLDFYDDKTGSILKSVCPTPDSLPGAVKVAHVLSSEERDVLRDDAFALILHNDGQVLRKFACVDEGNTVLSTLYFMETFDRLPPEAVKVAAARLAYFNEEFGLPVPKMLKLAEATGMARRRDSFKQPVVGDEADWAQRTNLVSVRGGADAGRVMQSATTMKTAALSFAPDQNQQMKQYVKRERTPVGRVLNRASDLMNTKMSAIDVSKLEPEFYTQNKKSKTAALRGKYSLDSYSDVSDAINFFEENWPTLDPADRHEFAVKTAARADVLGMAVPEIMERYGSTEYAPDVEAHLANRRATAPQFKAVWDDLQEKRAMIEPEVFAGLLREADELCNLNFEWGGSVADPFYATFGGRGLEKKAWAWEGADGTALDEKGLRSIPADKLSANFTPDFAQAFALDPVTIFESMPDQHKVLIARMAGG